MGHNVVKSLAPESSASIVGCTARTRCQLVILSHHPYLMIFAIIEIPMSMLSANEQNIKKTYLVNMLSHQWS